MGKKLKASTLNANDGKVDDAYEEYSGGISGRKKQQMKGKERYEIKSNIEHSRLWRDRDD